tara:strand:+ start:119 stop:265 length:147 start_codon:yes stop_codon:yes gene_type:complete
MVTANTHEKNPLVTLRAFMSFQSINSSGCFLETDRARNPSGRHEFGDY